MCDRIPNAQCALTCVPTRLPLPCRSLEEPSWGLLIYVQFMSSSSTAPAPWIHHLTDREDGLGSLHPQLLEEIDQVKTRLCAQPAPGCAAAAGPWVSGGITHSSQLNVLPQLPAASAIIPSVAPDHVKSSLQGSQRQEGCPTPGQDLPRFWGHSTAKIYKWRAVAVEVA